MRGEYRTFFHEQFPEYDQEICQVRVMIRFRKTGTFARKLFSTFFHEICDSNMFQKKLRCLGYCKKFMSASFELDMEKD